MVIFVINHIDEMCKNMLKKKKRYSPCCNFFFKFLCETRILLKHFNYMYIEPFVNIKLQLYFV